MLGLKAFAAALSKLLFKDFFLLGVIGGTHLKSQQSEAKAHRTMRVQCILYSETLLFFKS